MSLGALADTTNVFCASMRGDYWYWVNDQDGNTVQVEGEWHSQFMPNGTYFYFFSIEEQIYRSISTLCRPGEVVHPADNSLSKWFIFYVQQQDGSAFFTPGKYDVNRSIESDFQLRI